MLELNQSLQANDLGFLRIVAEFWGLELNAQDLKTCAQQLSSAMLDQPLVDEMIEKALAHIDKKRADLGLVEYDRNRFGESGDFPLEAFFATPPEERNLYSRKAYVEAAGED